jgi:hypothetical protein
MALAAIQWLGDDGRVLWTCERRGGRYHQTYPDGRAQVLTYFPRDRAPTDVLRIIPSPDPKRRAVIKIIFHLYSEGHGASFIAQELNRAGHRTDQNKLYYNSLVNLIVRRGCIFTGRYAYARTGAGRYARHTTGTQFEITEHIDPRRTPRHHSEWVMTERYAEPVISDELWHRCLELMESKRHRCPRRDGAAYAGLLICENCGIRMTSLQRCGQQRYGCQTYRLYRGKCGSNELKQTTLDELTDRYLEDVGKALEFASLATPMKGLWDDDFAVLDGTKAIRTAMELYLYDRLGQAFPFRQRGRHRHFAVPTPDGPDAHFRLPDFDGEPVVLKQLALWVEAGDNHRIKEQLQVLETEHSRLYQEYRAMPTEMMRARCQEEIERKEREIGALKGSLTTWGSQLRALIRQLHDLAGHARGARKASGALRRMALRRVLAEIRFEFRPVRKAKRTFQVLSAITFVPQLGDPVRYEGTPAIGSWRRGRAWMTSGRPTARSATRRTSVTA